MTHRIEEEMTMEGSFHLVVGMCRYKFNTRPAVADNLMC